MASCRLTAILCVLCVAAAAIPVRRSPEMEARRRSAIDRSLIRFGRSYPAEPSAADIREAFQRPTRRGDSFLRLGRSQPLTLSSEDIISLLKTYEDYDKDYESYPKRGTSFIRLGRDPKFIRFGRSDEDKIGEQSSDLAVSGFPQRKNRARDHFLRLGRDSEEVTDDDEVSEERRKRSTDAVCHDCQL